MRIKIQSWTPMDQSLKWEIHHHYFVNRGIAAWLQQDIPYAVTSNYRAAYQMAALFLTSIESYPPAPHEPIYVLETGAGLGLFALNFIRAFDVICESHQAPYAAQLHYILSDYASKTLAEVGANPFFQQLHALNRIEYVCLDITSPEAATDLEGQPWPKPAGGFRAIISNYNFCNLPTQTWRCTQGQWRTTEVETYCEIAHSDNAPHPSALMKALIDNLKTLQFEDPDDTEIDDENRQMLQVLDQAVQQLHDALWQYQDNPQSGGALAQTDYLETLVYDILLTHFQVRYGFLAAEALPDELRLPLQQASTALAQALENNLGECLRPLLKTLPAPAPVVETKKEIPFVLRDLAEPNIRRWLSEIGDQYAVTSLPYSTAALAVAQSFWSWLHPDGLWLIADKGVALEAEFAGQHDFDPSRHGGSLNYPVNFPLLQVAIEQQQGFVLRTTNPTFGLQVLMATPNGGLQQQLQAPFSTLFVTDNLNEFTYYLVKAAGDYALLGRYNEAASFYAKALEYLHIDAGVLYHLGHCYLKLGRYSQALLCLTAANDDYYGIYDFPRLAGQALFQMGHYSEALSAWQHSQTQWGEQPATCYQMGQCYQQTGGWRQAHQAFERALALEPQNTAYREALTQLHDQVFATWAAAQVHD